MSCISPAFAQPKFRGGCSEQEFRGSLLEFSTACNCCGSRNRLRGSAFISDEWQTAVLGGKNGYYVCQSRETVDLRLQCAGTEYIWGVGYQLLRKNITVVVVPHWTKHRFFTRFDCRYSKRALSWGLGKWRSEFCEAAEERRCTDFKSLNAPASFVRSPPNQGSRAAKPNLEFRGQHDNLTAETLSANGSAVSLELDGARRVKVIGAGAGASAVLNFCQQSSLLPSAQFWYSSDAASEFVLLSEYGGKSSLTSFGFGAEGNKDPLINHDNNEEIVFLVLGVGSGTALGFIPGQLKAVRSKGSLAVGIFIQPFMFESQKRLEQANQLIDGLLECTDMLLVVEQDGLLRTDVVTVSEASSIAKNAVLLSIKSIMELLEGKANISLGATIASSSATSDDTKMILQTAGRAWLGSGIGNTSIEAVEMAVAEAPTADPFGDNRLVLCTLASALDQTREEVGALKSILHQILGPDLQLVVCIVKNPMLEKGVMLTTIIITRLNSQEVTSSLFSDMTGDEYGGQSVIGIKTVDHNSESHQSVCDSVINSPNSSNLSLSESPQLKASFTVSGATVTPQGALNDNGSYSVNHEKFPSGTQILRPRDEWNSSSQKPKRTQSNRSLGKKSSVRSYRSPTGDVKAIDSKQVRPQALVVSTASQKLRLAWEAGPSSDVAEAWAQARADARKPTQVTSALDVSLPIGVRLDAEHSLQTPSENFASSTGFEVAEDKWIGTEAVPVDPDALPRNRMVDMGLEAVWDMYNAASALVMGRETTAGRKQASLSQRAASMLENERSQKKLTPLVEMGFKNGTYKGRCQEGLPEGKGRLSFSDGSFYDGQWKQGKRVGSGAFYYTNGDMFQGSWKDDVMHGKGWMYYHSGDRLYANFWKGKADGEGRFYSAQGDVFFGQYRENWRHGEFLYTEASGVRWSDVWENGILKSRTPVDY